MIFLVSFICGFLTDSLTTSPLVVGLRLVWHVVHASPPPIGGGHASDRHENRSPGKRRRRSGRRRPGQSFPRKYRYEQRRRRREDGHESMRRRRDRRLSIHRRLRRRRGPELPRVAREAPRRRGRRRRRGRALEDPHGGRRAADLAVSFATVRRRLQAAQAPDEVQKLSEPQGCVVEFMAVVILVAVSYTHLTLPTTAETPRRLLRGRPAPAPRPAAAGSAARGGFCGLHGGHAHP